MTHALRQCLEIQAHRKECGQGEAGVARKEGDKIRHTEEIL